MEAVRLYKKSLAINPLELYNYRGLGIIYTQLELYDRSMEQFQKAIQLGAGDPVVYYNLALNYWRLKDYAQMDQAIQQMLSFRNNSLSYLVLAADLTKGYDDKKAAAYLKEAMAMPNYNENRDFQAPVIQAYLLQQAGKQPEAEAILQRRLIYHQDQLKENPKDATQTWYVGAIYSLSGDTDNAILYMKKFLKLDIADYWWCETYAEYRNVYNDPRYKALMADARQQVAKMRAEVLAMEAKEQKKAFLD